MERLRGTWANQSEVTFSAGIAESVPDPVENGSLIDRANAALYTAKSAGRDTTVTDRTLAVSDRQHE